MEKMKFKTNIKCDGCIATVKPVLDEVAGPDNWRVDLGDPLRILVLDRLDIPVQELQARLATVGYQAIAMA